MAMGLIGRKAGMTRVYTDGGETVAVTVVEVLPESRHSGQIRGARRLSRGSGQPMASAARSCCPRAVAGHYAKAKVAPGRR